jgi:hypothetical protein
MLGKHGYMYGLSYWLLSAFRDTTLNFTLMFIVDNICGKWIIFGPGVLSAKKWHLMARLVGSNPWHAELKMHQSIITIFYKVLW